MILSKFDKIALVFLIIVSLIIVVSAVTVDVSKPYHYLSQLAISESDLKKVDADGDGIIDYANQAEMVKCPDGSYKEVGNCDGISGTGTGEPLIIKSVDGAINANKTDKPGQLVVTWDSGNLASEDTDNSYESIFRLDPYNGSGSIGIGCREENGWYAKGCAIKRTGEGTGTSNWMLNHAIRDNGCFDGEGIVDNDTVLVTLTTSCFKIEGNVVSDGSANLLDCADNQILVKESSGWNCKDIGAGNKILSGSKIISDTNPLSTDPGSCGGTIDDPCVIDISEGNFTSPICTITMFNLNGDQYTENMVVKNVTSNELKVWRGNFPKDTGVTWYGAAINWTCVERGVSELIGIGESSIPDCAEGEYLRKKNATEWECVTKEDIIGQKDVLMRMTHLSCGEYDATEDKTRLPYFTNSPSSCSNGGDNANWVLAAIVNYSTAIDAQGTKKIGENCVFGGTYGTTGSGNVYGDNTVFSNCINDASDRNALCDFACQSELVTTYGYRMPETYDSGYSIYGNPNTRYGEVRCMCIDND